MIADTINQFLDKCQKRSRIIIAYSGGVDSHVLLHALSSCQKEYRLNLLAVHIHHGLLQGADDWALHCEQVCSKLDVPYQLIKVNVNSKKGESVEAQARQARYNAFSTLMKHDDLLVVAHHQDDQAETFLLQLLRGAGLKGLSSMPVLSKFVIGNIARPFLAVPRAEILSYAEKNNLSWIEDNSNHDLRFDRNFVRHEVVPLLFSRWPGLSKTISRATKHIADANQLLETFAAQDFVSTQGKNPETLSVEKLQQLSMLRQKNILRYWIDRQGFLMPNEKHLDHVITDVMNAGQDSKPCVSWGDAEIRRHQDDIYVMKPIEPIDSSISLKWNYKQPLKLPGELGTLIPELQLGYGIDFGLLTEDLEVCFRKGGETCRLPGRTGTHLLKKLFQEWHVPIWLRDRIPLIFHQGDLIAVVGYAVSADYAASTKQKGLVVKRCQA